VNNGDWLHLVSDVIAEFEPAGFAQEQLTRRYYLSSDHEADKVQFNAGATPRRLKDMIRRSIAGLAP